MQKLRIAGAFGNERKDFYLWNTNPRNWSDISYQARSTYKYDIQHMKSYKSFTPSPQYMALGNFSINAIPEGYVQPKGNGKYDICINKVYLFINDSFNFDGHELLGFWELDPLTENLSLFSCFKGNLLDNGNFRDYQRHGYGRYFPVLSKLHEIEDFQPICKEYPFVNENH